MRYNPIPSRLFVENRQRLKQKLTAESLAVLNANDIPETNADGTTSLIPNSDLFYLTGIEQEETILVLFPEAADEKQREMLFIRDFNPETELWEGAKLSREDARRISGIRDIYFLSDFPRLFHRVMCECGPVYLNSNEHKRAAVRVESREARFVRETMERYPLHDYRRLAPHMHELRVVKSAEEINLLSQACGITKAGFERVLGFVQPGVRENEVEAEFAHEFIRNGARFAYLPIIASGANACFLHYISNSAVCRKGELLLLDVGANYANYNADMTRTIPVSGKFSRRQRQVYEAVLRVLRGAIAGLTPGKKPEQWQKEGEQMIERELVGLGLLTMREIKRQDPERPAFKKYFMHGLGHPLGLDVHDVGHTNKPIQEGWVRKVEPAIYIREEGLAVRLENDVLVTEDGTRDLMADIPLEAGDIEEQMQEWGRAGHTSRASSPRRR